MESKEEAIGILIFASHRYMQELAATGDGWCQGPCHAQHMGRTVSGLLECWQILWSTLLPRVKIRGEICRSFFVKKPLLLCPLHPLRTGARQRSLIATGRYSEGAP